MAYDNSLIDKRVVKRNIAKGLVDAAELKQIIEALPDRESNCERVALDGETEEPAADQAPPPPAASLEAPPAAGLEAPPAAGLPE